MSEKYVLKLFVAGDTPQSRNAVASLQRICEHEFANNCDLEIVDVLEDPEVAEREKVLATPALVKLAPPPVRRIVGDLADTARVLSTLDVAPRSAEERPDEGA